MRSERPTFVRAVLLYTAFDLKNLAGQASLLGLLLLPLAVLAPIGVVYLMDGTMRDSMGTPTVVLVDRTGEGGAIDLTPFEVEVVEVAPPDADARLADGRLSALVVLPLSPLDPPEVRLGSDEDGYVARRVTSGLTDWRVDRRLAEVGATPLAVIDAEGDPLDDGGDLFADLGAGTGALHGIGLMVIGLFGTLIGLGIGPALLTSMRTGFNHLLALGTPPRAVFTSELLTAAVVQISQALYWWLLYGVLAALAGVALDVSLPPAGEVLAVLPLLLLLAPLAMVQAGSVSLVMARMLEDTPTVVRENAARVVAFLPMLLFFAFGAGAASMTEPVAHLPVIGPVALWSHAVEDGGVLVPLTLQLAYTAAAVHLGGLVMLLDESPLDTLRRRLRAA